ncbi:MAG: NADH-quinone oxidoreductase subunit C [Dehalococcoidia bacterium]
MTNERGLNESPEERAARIQAAKDRAAAARAARESGAPPPAAASAPVVETEAEPVAAAVPPPADDRPRTEAGTLKRDPNEPKKEAPATPEERRARVEAAKAAAAAAKAAREAGGGAAAAARPAVAQAADVADEAVEEAAAAPSDGLERTAKGTIKRDPNAPKKEAPATPEERAARIAAAKAAAAAAKERAAAAPPPSAAAPAAARAARPAAGGPSAADQAAFRQAYEAVTRPMPGAEPVLKPVPTARAERPGARAEFPMTEAMEATLAAFRGAMPDVEFVEVFATPTDVAIVVERADLLKVMERANTHPTLNMKFLRSISGVDLMTEGIEVAYQLKSLTTKHAVTVKTLLPPHDLVVDSLTPLWAGANWHERELMEMFGVRCAGHPDPRNLLLDEDLTIHPLLKAHPLADVELKQGVNVF